MPRSSPTVGGSSRTRRVSKRGTPAYAESPTSREVPDSDGYGSVIARLRKFVRPTSSSSDHAAHRESPPVRFWRWLRRRPRPKAEERGAFDVIVEDERVTLRDNSGEILAWTWAEWTEDPSVVPVIAAAMRIGYREGSNVLRDVLAGRAVPTDG